MTPKEELKPQLCKDCEHNKKPHWTSKVCGECFFYDNNQQSNFMYKFTKCTK